MNKQIRTFAALAFAAAIALPSSAAIAESDPIMTSDAVKLRKLEVMLMVTSLRCRNGAHDFRGEYGQFSTMHRANLSAARADLKRGLNAQYGSNGTKRALDRMGVKMANTYGSGHPWLNCAELKDEVQALCIEVEHGQLLSAATRLLAPVRPQAAATEQAPSMQQQTHMPLSQTRRNWAEAASGD
ncbi:MAG: S-adenosyl-L-homocysteine hydrolase [Erythrobacter sp.]